jgi:hypothetical protein
MNDDELAHLLRTVLPPTRDEASRGNAWEAVLARHDDRPRWSLLDLGLATAVTVVLAFNPEWFWLLAYHL